MVRIRTRAAGVQRAGTASADCRCAPRLHLLLPDGSLCSRHPVSDLTRSAKVRFDRRVLSTVIPLFVLVSLASCGRLFPKKDNGQLSIQHRKPKGSSGPSKPAIEPRGPAEETYGWWTLVEDDVPETNLL